MSANSIAASDADARRLALEVIATLVNVKKTAAEQVLRPADVPEDLVRRFLIERDPHTGEKRTKREAGGVILEELTRRGMDRAVVRKLIALAAQWNAFHLAQDEYKARAVVQKARELDGILGEAAARELLERERRIREGQDREQREKEAIVAEQSALLLAQFDHAHKDDDHHRRGHLLEDLVNRLFDLHGIPVVRSFRRNSAGEQIDGAFEFEGWHYIVECRWRAKLADIHELDGLSGQVARSGRQTMGLFLSVNGWSENVVFLLKQNPQKSIILMEGVDLRTILTCTVSLRSLLKAKVSALNLDAEPFLPVSRIIK